MFNLQYSLANNLPTYVSYQPGILLLMNNLNATSRVANRCKVCKHINTATKAYIIHKTVTPCNYSCVSANVVYLIDCQESPEAQYIREAGGNIRYRFNNHTHSFREKSLLPLPSHFNADGHNICDLKFCILKGNFEDTKHRKLTEFQFIINFETNTFCIDKDISFLSRYYTF